MPTQKYMPLPLYAEAFSKIRGNADRGFRIEAYVNLGSNTVTFHEGIAPLAYLDAERERYKDYPFSLVQVYAYLTEYSKKPLDDKAFADLEAYLLGLQERKLRAVLRFAYEKDVRHQVGPKTKQIEEHLKQIKVFLEAHQSLIQETVLVIQAGFFGAWGEWHTAKHFHQKKKLLWHIADAIPMWMPLQVRREYLKKRIKMHKSTKRIGYHDDYLVGVYHKWSTPDKAPGSLQFDAFQNESRLFLNDGEMPWGKDTSYQNGHIDGKEMLEGCALRHLTTLSMTHNFIEDGKEFNMARWQGETLSGTQAMDLALPFSTTYFENAKGEPIERTVFDYLLDHLGYQIFVKEICFTESELFVTLSNNGFALPYGFSQLICHVVKADGTKKDFPFTDYQDILLLGHFENTFHVSGDFENAVKIGFSLRKPKMESIGGIQFANQCEFRENINWFSIKS